MNEAWGRDCRIGQAFRGMRSAWFGSGSIGVQENDAPPRLGSAGDTDTPSLTEADHGALQHGASLAKMQLLIGVRRISVSSHAGAVPFRVCRSQIASRSRRRSFSRFPRHLRIKDLCAGTRPRGRGNERNATFAMAVVFFLRSLVPLLTNALRINDRMGTSGLVPRRSFVPSRFVQDRAGGSTRQRNDPATAASSGRPGSCGTAAA